MDNFEARLLEAAGVVFPAIDEAIGTADDLTNLPKQYHYLQFVMEAFPEGVEEYLAQEPQHFAGLANQTTDASMAVYVHSMATRILMRAPLIKFMRT
jgi:hypothetical protein